MRSLWLLSCAAMVLVADVRDPGFERAHGEQRPAPAPRPIVVIGDLHMGPGRERAVASRADDAEPRSGAPWHAYEDFRWREEFVPFLAALQAESAGTDLVINGDLFELLQSPAVSCASEDPALGCSVPDALQRLDTVIGAHAEELQAIGRFASAGSNRVYIVPGDHDAALLEPAVWKRALAAFAAAEDRVRLEPSGNWLSPDGRVHVEHGHQLPLSADRFSHWPTPFVRTSGGVYLERPWGEQIILPFYHRAELRYPLVDNIAEEGVGAKLVAAADPAMTQQAVAPLLRFLLTKTTWQQFRMDLDDGDVQAPVWDITQIRANHAKFLTSSLPSDDAFAPLANAARPEQLRAAGEALTDQQIIAICDYRAAIRRARRRMERVLTQLPGVGPPIAECPREPDTVGPAFEHYWRSRDQQVLRHVPGVEKVDVIVFGHTHLLDRPFLPLRTHGPTVVTSGAWQRTVHPLRVKALDAPPESLPPCYTFMRVASVDGTWTPEARSWRLDEQQQWSMRAAGC